MQIIEARILESVLFKPSRITEPFSWVGHLKIANFIIKELNPTIFVELGTHTGNSYFSFCQSVLENNLSTKCFAIDTWAGDMHSGKYENNIFDIVAEHNKNYSEFSTLIRTTFDDALSQFEDSSIQLLHIDGLHTYEAVKHDFNSWLPKLAQGAVIIFHDTQVKKLDFGVFRLWEELTKIYPNNLEFTHSNGLGILQLNNHTTENEIAWLSKSKSEKIKVFRSLGISGEDLEQQISNEHELKKICIEFERLKNSTLAINLLEGQKENQKLVIDLKQFKLNNLFLENKIRSMERELSSFANSYSWLITKPFREIYRLIKTPKTRLWQYTEKLLNSNLLFLSINNRDIIYQKLDYLFNKSTINAVQLAEEQIKLELLLEESVFNRNKGLDRLAMLQYFAAERAAELNNLKITDHPRVSIIIPVYGKIVYTLACLHSMARNKPKCSVEIIIIDDCSDDETHEILCKAKDIRLIRNEENKGFIHSCNIGAAHANGEYLYFLNNDTEVVDGWLDNLIETFDLFPGTGLAGSKLIYPDGKLQEAGGIIWQDGSGWNYGRNNNPFDPIYNYAREVDYCSGASIMVPRSLFNDIGGFDEIYSPAYYEDVDIAFKVRQLGYRVIFQPMSIVIHHEGITSGTDVREGVKSYQVQNQLKLVNRWSDYLKSLQLPGENAEDAKDRRKTHRILILDNNNLSPTSDAGSLLVFNLCLLFRELNFQVTFIPTTGTIYIDNETNILQKNGIEVLYAPYIVNTTQHLSAYGDRYDVVLLVRPDCALKYVDDVKLYCTKAKVIFHTIDIHFKRLMGEAKIKSDPEVEKHAIKMREIELSVISKCDITIVVSEEDRRSVSDLLSDARLFKFGLILNTIDLPSRFEERSGIVFCGGFAHSPNEDAILFFINEIMPDLEKNIPDLCLYIVGSNIPERIKNLERQNIVVVGYVKDLSLFLSKMVVSIAPLRFGAGVKGKIATALSNGLPTVATSIATEGMGLTNGINILIEDDHAEFIRAINRLVSDKIYWMQVSQNGLDYAKLNWSARAAQFELINLLSCIGIDVEAGPYPLTLFNENMVL